MGQDPQHRNHHPHGHCHHIRHGELHVVNSRPTPSSPRVELESSPLPRHRSTFSASSEDLARPVREGEQYNRQRSHIGSTLYSRPLWDGWGGFHLLTLNLLTLKKSPFPLYIILRPRVAQECAPLTRHRWTFSPSSIDLVRPLWEGTGRGPN